ncbi:uncharacterized protein LOC123662462 [Melitaea cinxia]|uniref:uncharacterized protein LOC123662462 n=1 Tax=Melitaea cinxia TaxID=113334 RepID=UPI001E26F268|nr:uncharacterized protein LOC123662462 [Melitaea cinxia]
MLTLRTVTISFIICTSLFKYSLQVKFIRTIEAIGLPYYKISLKLGTCQENILFFENKVWPIARMNRIMDIYYKSEIREYTVSSVEVKLIINDTDCSGFSDSGVGFPEFTGTIFLANNMGLAFYSLTIYTCNQIMSKVISNGDQFVAKLPFYSKRMKSNS